MQKKKLTMELDSEIENCCCHMSTKFHAKVTVKHVETIAATSNIWAHLLFFYSGHVCVYIYIHGPNNLGKKFNVLLQWAKL
jgi:hypothetical protein